MTTATATHKAFMPADFDAGDWAQIERLFESLEKDSGKNLAKWLDRYSQLSASLAEEENRRYVSMTCHTDDPEKEKAHLYFQTEILPKCKPRWQGLKKKFLEHPGRKKLPKDRFALFAQHTENEFAIFRDANVPLEAKDAELSQKYQKICGEQMVTFDGKAQTIPMMGKYLEETDRSVRQKAWEAIVERRARDRGAVDALYDEQIKIRTRIGRNAGFQNYRDYAFRMRGRFDYTPEDCLRFHDAVEKLIVLALRKRHEHRKRLLKVDVLRPWDLNVDPHGRPPLRPFATAKELIAGCRAIFNKVHPDFAKKFVSIEKAGHLDLDSRKGKAPGGYMTVFDVERKPFIFTNAAGLHRDVQTLLHEGGHSFHSLLTAHDDFHFNRGYPIEFAEVASMGMEMLGQPFLDEFYTKAEANRARAQHLEDTLKVFPWICTIDAFQHQLYTAPDHSREDRRQIWLKLRGRFRGGDDWSSYQEDEAYLWQQQNHLFTVPFYYIEYAIAQMGALQVWQNARTNRKAGVAKYRAGLSLGWTRGLPELFKAAGLNFDFSERTLKPLIEAVMEELGKLE